MTHEQLTRVNKNLVQRILDQLNAGSTAPRVTCSACGEVFVEKRILMRMDVGQEHVACPKCKTLDTLRESTPDELARVAVSQNALTRTLMVALTVAAALGAAFVLYVILAL